MMAAIVLPAATEDRGVPVRHGTFRHRFLWRLSPYGGRNRSCDCRPERPTPCGRIRLCRPEGVRGASPLPPCSGESAPRHRLAIASARRCFSIRRVTAEAGLAAPGRDRRPGVALDGACAKVYVDWFVRLIAEGRTAALEKKVGDLYGSDSRRGLACARWRSRKGPRKRAGLVP